MKVGEVSLERKNSARKRKGRRNGAESDQDIFYTYMKNLKDTSCTCMKLSKINNNNPPRSWYWNRKHIKTAMWVSHCLKDIYKTINSRKDLFGLLVSEISVCVQLVHLPWSQGDAKYHYSVAVSKNAIQPMVARKQREAGWSGQDRHFQSISPGTDFV